MSYFSSFRSSSKKGHLRPKRSRLPGFSRSWWSWSGARASDGFQPLWKIWVRQLGWWFPYIMEKHVPNHQPVYIMFIFYFSRILDTFMSWGWLYTNRKQCLPWLSPMAIPSWRHFRHVIGYTMIAPMLSHVKHPAPMRNQHFWWWSSISHGLAANPHVKPMLNYHFPMLNHHFPWPKLQFMSGESHSERPVGRLSGQGPPHCIKVSHLRGV